MISRPWLQRLATPIIAVLLFSPMATAAGKPKPQPKATSDTALRALQVLGGRVMMDLPPSFAATDRFVGYYDTSRQISFVSAEMPPEAYESMVAGFNADALSKRGFLDPKTATLARADRHIYLRAAQSTPAGLYQKFLLVFAAPDATVTISGNVPTPMLSSSAVTEADIERMLVSARLAPTKSDLKQLVTLADTASLKPALVYGQTQIWTEDGKSGSAGATSPSIIVAASTNYDVVDNAVQLSTSALAALSGQRNIAFKGNAKRAKLGPHTGVELTASADDATSAQPRFLYQFLLPQASGGYVRLIGIAPYGDRDLWLIAFRRAVASMRVQG